MVDFNWLVDLVRASRVLPSGIYPNPTRRLSGVLFLVSVSHFHWFGILSRCLIYFSTVGKSYSWWLWDILCSWWTCVIIFLLFKEIFKAISTSLCKRNACAVRFTLSRYDVLLLTSNHIGKGWMLVHDFGRWPRNQYHLIPSTWILCRQTSERIASHSIQVRIWIISFLILVVTRLNQ
jgi:hypothetical protein